MILLSEVDYVIICAAALAGSALTFFSGFGLGTVLLPVFGVFFPLDIAVALTAVVHFLNNLFKLALVGKNTDRTVAVRFGIPSLLAAIAGATALSWLANQQGEFYYHAGTYNGVTTPLNVIMAALIFFFALFDLLPGLSKVQFSRRHLVSGGLLSGFFGGLSGMQGALRSAFLVRSGLSKEAFIATGVVIACLVDVARLLVYSGHLYEKSHELDWTLTAAATLAAFTGAFAGSRLLRKITIRTIQRIVGLLLIGFSILLAAGII